MLRQLVAPWGSAPWLPAHTALDGILPVAQALLETPCWDGSPAEVVELFTGGSWVAPSDAEGSARYAAGWSVVIVIDGKPAGILAGGLGPPANSQQAAAAARDEGGWGGVLLPGAYGDEPGIQGRK